MLRNVLALLIAGFAVSAASAQTPHSHAAYHHPATPGYKAEQRILSAQQTAMGTAEKSTVLKARLIAVSAYNQGMPYDSTRFFYSGMRGSGTILSNSGYAAINAGNDGISNVAADSSLEYEDDGSSMLTLEHRTTATYSSANKIMTQTDHVYDPSNASYYSLSYTYNTAGYYTQITYSDTLQTNTSTLQPSLVYYARYNAQNKIIYDSIYDIVNATPQQKDVFTYNGAGYQTLQKSYTFNGTQATLNDSAVMTYDASNRIKTSIDYSLSFGMVQGAYADSFGYTGANTLYTYEASQSYDPVANTWTTQYAEADHLNSAGNNYDTTTIYFLGFNPTNSLEPFEQSVSHFNADGTLQRTDEFDYNNGVLDTAPDGQRFFYYEQYNVTTGVTPVAGADDIKIYPNPADSWLTVSLGNDALTAASGRIIITDGSGRRLLSEAVSNRNVISVNLGGFPAGWYSISVTAGNGSVLHSGHFIRK